MSSHHDKTENLHGAGSSSGPELVPHAIDPVLDPNDQTPAKLALELMVHQRQCWEKGERLVTEDYLKMHPDLQTDHEGFLDLVYNEIVLREKAGESPTYSEYAQRFPKHREELQPLFAVHHAIENGEITSGQVSDSEEALPPSPPGYKLIGVLGRGGMGIVTLAKHLQLNRLVAVKMLAFDQRDRNGLERLRAEARAIASLQHPNIVQIYDVGETATGPFLALEYVPGGSLGQFLAGNPQPPVECARFVALLAHAIQYAHDRNLIHRDLKPGNILLGRVSPWLDKEGQPTDGVLHHLPSPKITDFGLVKHLGEEVARTVTGAILGTPSYMAPEQCATQSHPIGTAVDVYALGAILYEMVTGRPPFKGTTILETIEQVRAQDPVSPRQLQPSCPRDLETVCLKCLNKEPGRRYSSALALADDLQAFAQGKPIKARPVGGIERIWRWAYRKPAIASLLVMTTIAILVFIAFLFRYSYSLELEVIKQQLEFANQNLATSHQATKKALNAEERAKNLAEQQREAAEMARGQARAALERESLYRYFNRIWLAQSEFHNNNLARARMVLQECPKKLRGWEWFYLDRLCNPETFILKGFFGPILDMDFTSDGSLLAVADGGSEVTLWKVKTGQLHKRIAAGNAEARALAFHPNREEIAVGGQAKGWRIIDFSSGETIFQMAKNTGTVLALEFSPQGDELFVAYEEPVVEVWDLAARQMKWKWTFTRKGDRYIAENPVGDQLAIATTVGSIQVQDSNKGINIKILDRLSRLGRMDFSPDGKLLATICHSYERSQPKLPISEIKIIDTARWRVIRTLRDQSQKRFINDVAFSRDGKTILSGGDDRIIRLWNVQTGELQTTTKGHTGAINRLAISPDGSTFASGSSDRFVRIGKVKAQQGPFKISLPQLSSALAFSPDGKEIATVVGNGELQIFHAGTGKLIKGIPTGTKYPSVLRFLADGSELLVADTYDIKKFKSSDGGLSFVYPVGNRERYLGLSPDNHLLVALRSKYDRQAKGIIQYLALIDLQEKQTIGEIAHKLSRQDRFAICPKGQVLAFTESNSNPGGKVEDCIVVWDIKKKQRTASIPSGPVTSLTFSPDGNWLTAATIQRQDETEPGVIRIWELANLREVLILEGHQAPITNLAYHPRQARLASMSKDKTIRIWDLHTGEETLAFQLEVPGHDLVFCPDGHLLAALVNNAISIWEAGPGLK